MPPGKGNPFKKGNKIAKGGRRPGAGRKPEAFKEAMARGAQKTVKYVLDVAEGKDVAVAIIPQTGQCVKTPAETQHRLKAFEIMASYGFGKPQSTGELDINVKGLPLVSISDLFYASIGKTKDE